MSSYTRSDFLSDGQQVIQLLSQHPVEDSLHFGSAMAQKLLQNAAHKNAVYLLDPKHQTDLKGSGQPVPAPSYTQRCKQTALCALKDYVRLLQRHPAKGALLSSLSLYYIFQHPYLSATALSLILLFDHVLD